VSQGEVQRWYYSTEIGQIRIRNREREWHEMVKDKLDDFVTPALITYRNVTQKKDSPST
jgi:hypothetical protein